MTRVLYIALAAALLLPGMPGRLAFADEPVTIQATPESSSEGNGAPFRGMSAEDRKEVQDLFRDLQKAGTPESIDARQKLVAKAQTVDVMTYLESIVSSLSPRLMSPVLEVMCDIDPERAKPALNAHAADPSYVTRAGVLALIGRVHHKAGVKFAAQGMLDHAIEVRIAAAKTLGELDAKEATPLLIENLTNPEPRLSNTCRAVLSKLWSTSDQPVDFETPEEWTQLWQEKMRMVATPYTSESLTPLVLPEEEWQNE